MMFDIIGIIVILEIIITTSISRNNELLLSVVEYIFPFTNKAIPFSLEKFASRKNHVIFNLSVM